MEDEKKEYLITIEGKDKRRKIQLSAFGFNFGVIISSLNGLFAQLC